MEIIALLFIFTLEFRQWLNSKVNIPDEYYDFVDQYKNIIFSVLSIVFGVFVVSGLFSTLFTLKSMLFIPMGDPAVPIAYMPNIMSGIIISLALHGVLAMYFSSGLMGYLKNDQWTGKIQKITPYQPILFKIAGALLLARLIV